MSVIVTNARHRSLQAQSQQRLDEELAVDPPPLMDMHKATYEVTRTYSAINHYNDCQAHVFADDRECDCALGVARSASRRPAE